MRAADFRLSPVWVCAYAFDTEEPWHREVDEVTYRPWDGPLPFTDEDWFPYVICKAAVFLADGQEHDGFARAPDASRADPTAVSITQPVLLLSDGSAIGLYNAQHPSAEELDKFYLALGKRKEHVFPMKFRLAPELLGSEFIGVIPGFCKWDLDVDRVTVTR